MKLKLILIMNEKEAKMLRKSIRFWL